MIAVETLLAFLPQMPSCIEQGDRVYDLKGHTLGETLRFKALAGNAPVQCGSLITGLGSGNNSAQLKDLRFYVANIKLIRQDGTRVALQLTADDWTQVKGNDTVSLIDLENGTGACSAGTAAMNASLTGTAPTATYVGVEYTLGVPFALNHTDYATATKPLDVQAMAWSWQVGRKFAKVEVTDPDGAAGSWVAKTFNVHLGSTGCTGNPANGETVSCVAPNRGTVVLSAFDPATQVIALDVQALLAGNDITRNQAGASGCMSGGTDPECAKVFEALAIDWKADGTGTGQSLAPAKLSTVFKAVAP
jgi:uncharacterized repeat protein (TIGR04052 family)